jgi:hypothetical protein
VVAWWIWTDDASVNDFFGLLVLVVPALDGAVAAGSGLDLDDVSFDAVIFVLLLVVADLNGAVVSFQPLMMSSSVVFVLLLAVALD